MFLKEKNKGNVIRNAGQEWGGMQGGLKEDSRELRLDY